MEVREMSDQANTGRKIVITIIFATVGISLLVIITRNLLIGPQKLPQDVVRFIYTIVLAFFLYRGAGWARWVVVNLYGLGGIFGIVGGMMLLATSRWALLLVVMGVIYFLSAGVVLFSHAVKVFLAPQKDRA